MATPSPALQQPHPVGWPSRLTKARLHFVTGKGGTGKSTIAASLALALAAGGRKVLLVEVEGRQGIAQLFDVPPLPYEEVKIATADGGGQVNALAIDTEAAFLEYLDMFYNLGIAGRAMRRIGAIEFATTIAPGLRDVLLTGKIKEIVVRSEKERRAEGQADGYDAVVVDSPPTGRIARFLDVTKAVSDLAKGGPVHSQADGVVKLLHSDLTAIHLVTLLEALPIQETVEAIDELKELGLPIGSVIVNRNIPAYLDADDLAKAAEGDVDADAVRAGLPKAGITLPDDDFAGLLTETIQHATRIAARAESAEQLDELDVPRLELPAISDGVDLGSLYELAEALAQQGVDERCAKTTGEPAMSTTPAALDLRAILSDRSNRVVVCCGAGGVGKTTTAAAMALRAAEYGRTVVVLTIDPAKRLAQALGIKDLGNTPQRVPLAPEVTGELHAMMLDMRRTFDEMVRPVLRRRPRRGDSGEPVLPNRRHVARGHAGVHGDGEARPAARRGQVGPGRRRHSAVAQRARLPRRAKAPRQLHGQPAVAAAAGARPRHRPAGDRRGRPGDEGAVDRARLPNALGRSRFRAGTGLRRSADSARRPTAPTNC